MLGKAIAKIYSSFLSLLDTPSTYSGQGGKFVKVNPGETGLEFGTGGGSLWTQSGSDIYYNTGNVGIGTTTPTKAVHAYKYYPTYTGGENDDLIWGQLIVRGTAPSPYTNMGSALHVRAMSGGGGSAPVGTIHGISSHARLDSSGNTSNELTALFLDTVSEDGGRLWGTDQNVMGPITTQANLLLGASIYVGNYMADTIANGGWGLVVTTKAGAGGGDYAADRAVRQTYALDAGICVVGNSSAANGFNTGIQIGGYAGGWMASSESSTIGTGLSIKDWKTYGINIPSRKAGGTGPSISVASGAGRAEFLSGIKVGNFTETASAGAIRYDSTNSFQGYHGGAWGALGGGVNAFDGGAFTDTYVATVNFDGGAF